MTGKNAGLRDVLNTALWQQVQDELANTTGTAITTIDFKGSPVTRTSCRRDFCTVVRSDGVLCRRCQRCDALGGLEAVRMGGPYIYLCHCGIVNVAVPIVMGERYLGAVQLGQVRLPGKDPQPKVERLVNEICSFHPEQPDTRQDLMEKYSHIPEMTYERLTQAANLAGAMIQYIVGSAVAKNSASMGYTWLLRANGDGLAQGENLLTGLHQEYAGAGQGSGAIDRSSPLYPAVQYVKTHPCDTVSMHEMAQLCNLSPSYFSRSFSREMGEGFTAFVSRQKVEYAKTELRGSTKSISQIATELGYLNTSHFINLFKRYEGVTPLIFRQSK